MTAHSSALSEFTDHIRQARTAPTPEDRLLRVRGGGSKDFFGAGLRGQLVSTQGLHGIVSYEPTELVVTVQAGTPLVELEAALLEKNQCLPFEPPHFGPAGTATVGGMVAAGLSGPARASVGAAKDYVLGARFVNGRGEHLTFGGQVMKNVAGYDVSRLLAGSWGTLGVITEVSLKVLAFAPSEATLVCDVDQSLALALLHGWGSQPLPLNASCWVHDPADGDKLFVRLRGAVAAVQAALPRMRADVLAQGGSAQVMDNVEAGRDWLAARDQCLPFFNKPPSSDLCLWRLSVAQTAPVLDLPYAQLLEWHGGQRWLWAPVSAAAQLHALAQGAGGHATLFRRPAGALADADDSAPVFAAQDVTQSRIQSALQQQFDPDGVFNTRRLHSAA
jgi:glycolate oxidase FAD binding subunit